MFRVNNKNTRTTSMTYFMNIFHTFFKRFFYWLSPFLIIKFFHFPPKGVFVIHVLQKTYTHKIPRETYILKLLCNFITNGALTIVRFSVLLSNAAV